ncbi:MAG: TraB/GumN family protein, partial [Duncaniella sp.]|nr:TraB/GumN family protein [Duncaniella sp.]
YVQHLNTHSQVNYSSYDEAMKKLFILLAILLTMTFKSSAQLMWQLSRPGDDVPVSYLLGTYHLADYSTVDSIAGITKVIERVDGVVGELDFAKASGMEAQMTMAMLAAAPADSTLSTVLSQAQSDSLQVALDRYLGGARVAQFEGMRPGYIAMLIEVARAAELTGNLQNPVDMAVQSRALEAGKSVSGLETVEDQCRALFGGDIIEQAESLMLGVAHDGEMKSTSRRIFEAYLHGDLNEILSIIENDRSMDAAQSERLIQGRNADWLRVLAGMLPAASLLIVVGAGHLPGEKGLLNGLRKLGFDVTPVE